MAHFTSDGRIVRTAEEESAHHRQLRRERAKNASRALLECRQEANSSVRTLADRGITIAPSGEIVIDGEETILMLDFDTMKLLSRN